MNVPFRSDYPPRNDVVFSIIFEDIELFSALLKSVTGHVLDADKVISQASVTPDNVEHNYIRFDTFAKDKNGTIYSIDLQNTYAEELLKNRTIYYACRSVAGQTVTKGRYNALDKVVISFIMTKKNKNIPIETIKLRDENGNIYSELLTLYNVYVPTVNSFQNENISKDLKIFSLFFSVENEEQMKNFIDVYSSTPLGEKLLAQYSKAVCRGDLENIRAKEYFDMKITEQDISEARKEARAQGLAQGLAQGIAQGIEKGIAKGRAEGKLEEKFKVLKNLIGLNMPKPDMAKILDTDENGIDNMILAMT